MIGFQTQIQQLISHRDPQCPTQLLKYQRIWLISGVFPYMHIVQTKVQMNRCRHCRTAALPHIAGAIDRFYRRIQHSDKIPDPIGSLLRNAPAGNLPIQILIDLYNMRNCQLFLLYLICRADDGNGIFRRLRQHLIQYFDGIYKDLHIHSSKYLQSIFYYSSIPTACIVWQA